MPHFTVTDLAGEDLDQALPLVRLTSPDLCVDGWRRHAEEIVRRGGGVVGVTADNGLVHGVALYEPRDMLRLGRVLQVDDLITVELSRKAPVHQVLVETLSRLARSLGCTSLAVSLPSWGFVKQRSIGASAKPLDLASVTFSNRLSSLASVPALA